MSIVKTAKKNSLSGHRILIAALAISFAGHLFWLSAVRIVSAPASKSPVKFSKIAFLGPILARVDMDFRATPAARSSLEVRYRKILNDMLGDESKSSDLPGLTFESREIPDLSDKELSVTVDSVVAGEKIEPDYPAE